MEGKTALDALNTVVSLLAKASKIAKGMSECTGDSLQEIVGESVQIIQKSKANVYSCSKAFSCVGLFSRLSLTALSRSETKHASLTSSRKMIDACEGVGWSKREL